MCETEAEQQKKITGACIADLAFRWPQPPDMPDPAPPPNCDESLCMDGNDATLWARVVLYSRPVPAKPTP